MEEIYDFISENGGEYAIWIIALGDGRPEGTLSLIR